MQRLRTCIGCSKSADKVALQRIVRTAAGDVFYDASGRTAGRGAYVCSLVCLRAARKSKKLERALKCSINNACYDTIEQAIAAAVAPTDTEE